MLSLCPGLSCPVVPALSADCIAAHVRGDDPGPGAVADLAPHHWMAAKGLGLALGALGQHRPRGADTVAGHRFTQPRPTVTGCGEDKGGQSAREQRDPLSVGVNSQCVCCVN